MRIRIHFHLQDVKSDLPQTSGIIYTNARNKLHQTHQTTTE